MITSDSVADIRKSISMILARIASIIGYTGWGSKRLPGMSFARVPA